MINPTGMYNHSDRCGGVGTGVEGCDRWWGGRCGGVTGGGVTGVEAGVTGGESMTGVEEG